MLQAICNILDLSQQFPDLDLAPLLRPVIAAAKTRYSLEALMPKVTRMRRLLPDTALREALLRRGKCLVTGLKLAFCTAPGCAVQLY